MPDQPFAKCVQENNVEVSPTTLRIGGRDGLSTLSIRGLGHACSSASRVGCGAKLALGVLMHYPLIGGHSTLGVFEVEVVGEVVLSGHGLGEVVGDINGSVGGRHGC